MLVISYIQSTFEAISLSTNGNRKARLTHCLLPRSARSSESLPEIVTIKI